MKKLIVLIVTSIFIILMCQYTIIWKQTFDNLLTPIQEDPSSTQNYAMANLAKSVDFIQTNPLGDSLVSEVYTDTLLNTNSNHFKTEEDKESIQRNELYEEIVDRRNRGFFDGILLGNLLVYTEVLQQPGSVCNDSFGTEMVTLVQSACPHKDHRNAIRETWGRLAWKLKVPVIFFVGQCPDIREESDKFHDVVEVNFKDTYQNLTLKSLSRFKWFIENCNQTRSLLMMDDDHIVIIDMLLEYMKQNIGFSMVGTYLGLPWNIIPRVKFSKWYVPKMYYPSVFFPRYVAGWAYVVNGTYVERLFKASLEVPFLTIDDILFTGYAAESIGMRRIAETRFTIIPDYRIRCDNTSILRVQSFSPEMTRSYWSQREKECRT